MSIIKVENLSKKYVLSHQQAASYENLRDVLAEKARQFGRKVVHPFTTHDSRLADSAHEEFWALKDVSFEVQQGDRIGIIGRNGAGKSTLLKILSRIVEPTAGRVSIKGRVASLLEVGTGFHPELTGRENVFLNGAILGMSRVEIQRKFDEIVAFAEVEKFLDTPVKRYSSGMYVRLAFAVAAHLEPEILIVDEVLAVGDAQFQKKCLGKMEDVSRAEGRTVLFVSHNMAAIKTLCNKGIILNNGSMLFKGPAGEAVDIYQGAGNSGMNYVSWDEEYLKAGNEFVRMKSIAVNPSEGDVVTIDSGIDIALEFNCWKEKLNLDLTLYLYTLDNVCVFESGVIISTNKGSKIGLYRASVKIPPSLLNSGLFRISVLFGESQRYPLFRIDDAVMFEVYNTATGRGDNLNNAPGIIRPNLEWSSQYNG